MKKDSCKTCKGTKSSNTKTISTVLKLGSKSKKTVPTVEKVDLINDVNNTLPNPVLTISPILPEKFELKNTSYKKIGQLKFPSRI